jgi:ABC-type oligopeptide transport system substrate-binding subunit
LQTIRHRAQGWFFNTRRDRFKDKRLREAFIYAFDFEWTNKNIMYGSYERTHFMRYARGIPNSVVRSGKGGEGLSINHAQHMKTRG